ncbi:MAG: hypothetical protein Q9199_004418 [Rusavskia elegans]
MSSHLFLKTISLLLLTLPILICFAPAPGARAQAVGLPTFFPDRYNISAAELRTIDAVGLNFTGGSVVGKNSTLKFTISGVNPGNLPIPSELTWFHETAQVGGYWLAGYESTAPALYVAVMEVQKPTPETVRFYLLVRYG